MFLAMSATDFIQYTNYAFIGILVIGALMGLWRGLFKSIYYLVVFVGMALLAWFVLSPLIIDSLLDWNLNITISGVTITSIRASMPEIMSLFNSDYASLMVEGTETYTLMMGLMTMIVRIVFTISVIILTMTGLKLIFAIIYKIIAPKNKDKDGNPVKMSFGSRMGGLVVGAIHAFLLLLLLAIPISGISEIGSKVSEISQNNNNTEEVEYKVLTDGSRIILLSNRENLASTNDTLKTISPYFSIYRSSVYGKVFSYVKMNNRPLDEKLFDTVLSVDYNNKKISLTNDIIVGIDIYNTLNKEVDGKWSLEAIVNIDETILNGAAQKLGDLGLINALVPIAAEVVLKTDAFKKQLGPTIEEVNADKVIQDLKAINLNDDIVNLGLSLVSIGKSGILEISKVNKEDEEGHKVTLVEVLNKLDSKLIDEGFKKVGDVEIFNVIGDIGLKYLANAQFMNKYLESAGMTSSDLNFEGVSLSDNLANLGGVIIAIQGLNMSDEDMKKIDLSKYSEAQTDKLVDSLYKLSLLSKNTELLAAVVREEFFPAEYKALLPRKEMTAKDMKSVIKVAKVMLTGENIASGNITIESLLNKDTIDTIVSEATNSEYVAEIINGAGSILIDTLCESLHIEPEAINLEGVNWVEELEPLTELIDIAQEIGIDITKGTASNIKIEDLTEEQINKFAVAVFESKVMSQNTELILNMIKKNIPESYSSLIPTKLASSDEFIGLLKLAKTASKTMSGGKIDLTNLDTDDIADAVSSLNGEQIESLITGIIDSTGLIDVSNLDLPNIDTSTAEGIEEVQKLLGAVETISSVSGVSDLKDLAEDEIENITSSKVATSVVVELLTQETQEGGSLSGFITLDGISEDEWADSEEGSGELKKLMDATSVLMDDKGEIDMSVDKISNLTDEDISTLTDSKVITNSLSENLNDIIADEITSTFDQEKYGYELNLGTVEVKEGENAGEVWAQEVTVIRDVVEMSSNIEETDLSDESTAQNIGQLLDAGKDSQILGDSVVSIADSILQDAYAGIDGYDAPTVDENTNFAEEFAILQALLAAQSSGE